MKGAGQCAGTQGEGPKPGQALEEREAVSSPESARGSSWASLVIWAKSGRRGQRPSELRGLKAESQMSFN